jgi:hypothetical protein
MVFSISISRHSPVFIISSINSHCILSRAHYNLISALYLLWVC